MEPRNICQTEASTYTKPMPTINKLHQVQNQHLLQFLQEFQQIKRNFVISVDYLQMFLLLLNIFKKNDLSLFIKWVGKENKPLIHPTHFLLEMKPPLQISNCLLNDFFFFNYIYVNRYSLHDVTYQLKRCQQDHTLWGKLLLAVLV